VKINIVKWANVTERIRFDKEMQRAFLKFYNKLKDADWNNPNDVLKTFNTADIINCAESNRIVFNVGGNKYRMICGYHFGKTFIQLFIKFVGNHAAYEAVDVCKVIMFEK